MSTKTDTKPAWASVSPDLYDAYSDFRRSRKAMSCSDRTIARHAFTLGRVMEWMAQHGVRRPSQVTAYQVRAYLCELSEQKSSDDYILSNARTIRTLLRFFHNE